MKRFWIWLLVAALTLVGVYAFVLRGARVPWERLADITPIYYALLLLGVGLELLFRVLRLRLVCATLGVALTPYHAIQTLFTVDLLAALTPARLGGEVGRFISLKRAGASTSQSSLVVAAENVIDLAYILVGASWVLWTLGQENAPLWGLFQKVLMILGALLVLSITALRFSRGFKLPHSFRSFLQEFRNAIVRMRWVFWVGLALTMTWWSLRFLSLYWIALGLGFHIDLKELFTTQFLLFQTLVYTPIPVGGGAFEGAFMWVYRTMLPQSDLPLAMILWRFFTFYILLIVGAFVVSRRVITEALAALSKRKRPDNP